MATTSDVVDALAQGLERAYPAVVFGRLNPGNDGFRVQLSEEKSYIVTVREAGFWDAQVMDFDLCAPSREDLDDDRA